MSPGRPIQYGTSDFFLEYLGVNSLADLPKLSDLAVVADEAGDDKSQAVVHTVPVDASADPVRHNDI
jgi:hypothetical protein